MGPYFAIVLLVIGPIDIVDCKQDLQVSAPKQEQCYSKG